MLLIALYFGYLASLLLIIALLVSNDLKFRWFNTFGNIAFITYAIVLGAVPVLLTNAILLTINLYYLIKIYSRQENFDLIEFKGEEKLVNKFLAFYSRDVKAYFPGFKTEAIQGNLNFVVLRDLVIANMFSAAVSENGDATVAINYTVKKYRDYKVGTFIFEKEKQLLLAKGVKRIVYQKVFNKQHLRFIKKMGFVKELMNGEERFVKTL